VLTLDDRVIEVLVEPDVQAFNVLIGERVYEVETARRGQRRRRRRHEGDQFVGGKWLLRTPLTGVVMEVRVAVGDRVAAGDVLLVVEAMKMLNELRARVPGVVSAVHVAGRDLVEIGNPLVEVSEEARASRDSGPAT